ncbi:tyrosine-type recombinase/integrase [Carboxylicivirga sp. RSCT41]|uniref:tyrosine-type recombinase/integrase n=1 Tax=Carboxylicivirga agarovorans TaxID=3417570 RepID=UPI003D3558F7
MNENNKHKTILSVIYGSGLRIGEVLKLHTEDLDSKRMRIRILGAKGKKDRYTIIGQYTFEYSDCIIDIRSQAQF